MDAPSKVWADFLSRNFWRLFAIAILAIVWYEFEEWFRFERRRLGQTIYVNYRDETDPGTLILKRPQHQLIPAE